MKQLKLFQLNKIFHTINKTTVFLKMYIFRLIDWFSILYGVKLIRSHWLIRLLNNFFFVFYVYDGLLFTVLISLKTTQTFTVYVSMYYSLFCALLSAILFRFKRNTILELLTSVNQPKTKKGRFKICVAFGFLFLLQFISIADLLFNMISSLMKASIHLITNQVTTFGGQSLNLVIKIT